MPGAAAGTARGGPGRRAAARWAGALVAAVCGAGACGGTGAACATHSAASRGAPAEAFVAARIAGCLDAGGRAACPWRAAPQFPRSVRQQRAHFPGALQCRAERPCPLGTAGRAAAHVLLVLVLAAAPPAAPPAAPSFGQAPAPSTPLDRSAVLSTTTSSASTVKEELNELTSRIEKIEQQRAEQGPADKEGHSDDEFQSLVNKMQNKHPAPDVRKAQMVAGSHRAPRAEYSGQGKYRAALRDAGFNLREANRLLILEAWDIIHRGSYGYPGWFDPNNGLYVDPETFLFEDRKEIIRGIPDSDLASPAVAHDVIRRMVADLQDPYSRFSEASELTINADDHSKRGRSSEHIEERAPGESSGMREHAPQAKPSHLALDGATGKRLVGVGLQLADPLDGEEDLVVVAPIPNSPAEAAGIQPLDRILAIDDLDVRKYRLTTGEATNLLRGWEDTEVRVLIQRARRGDGSIPLNYDAMGDRLPRQRPFVQEDEGGEVSGGRGQGQGQTAEWGKVESLSLKRKKLNIPPVLSGVLEARAGGEKIGYLRVNYFSRAGTDALAQAVAEMEKQGVSGYIIGTFFERWAPCVCICVYLYVCVCVCVCVCVATFKSCTLHCVCAEGAREGGQVGRWEGGREQLRE